MWGRRWERPAGRRRWWRCSASNIIVTVVVDVIIGIVIVVARGARSGALSQFFALHPSILEPDFDLAFGEAGAIAELVALLLGDVRVGEIFFF